MANQLKMEQVQAILSLKKKGWSNRKIAEALGVHRTTVAAYLNSKPTKVAAGSEEEETAATEPSDAASDVALGAGDGANSAASRSACEPYRQAILAKLEQGLSAQRIYQDLIEEENFSHAYNSVKRFVAKLCQTSEKPFRRMECEPGEEAQVDFGQGAPVFQGEGKRRRRPHLLRVVLSHSRKGYCEVVDRQTTENFIRLLENAFWHFGGVPKTLVIDNLRAAVSKADWFDPELNPKIVSFAAHYGTVFLPTRVRTPRHKGKVERGVDYAQENALKGKTFGSLIEQNEHLWRWESNVADTRVHGTTREHVGKAFCEREKAALQPLPLERFPFFHEGRRTVHRDGHVSVEQAYYSAPPEYLGKRVWARWDARLVRIYNDRMEQIALHARQERGKFSTQRCHLASEKISGVEQGAAWWLKKTRGIGPKTHEWAAAMIQSRGVAGVRVLMGINSLADKHPHAEIERACETALSYGEYRLPTIRKLLKHQEPLQQQFEFIEDHPVIRPLTDYSEFVQSAIHNTAVGHAPTTKEQA